MVTQGPRERWSLNNDTVRWQRLAQTRSLRTASATWTLRTSIVTAITSASKPRVSTNPVSVRPLWALEQRVRSVGCRRRADSRTGGRRTTHGETTRRINKPPKTSFPRRPRWQDITLVNGLFVQPNMYVNVCTRVCYVFMCDGEKQRERTSERKRH